MFCKFFATMVRRLGDIRDLLQKILWRLDHPVNSTPSSNLPYALRYSFPALNRQTFIEIQGDSTMNITTEQQVNAHVAGAKTAAGNPAQIFGAVTFTSSDETVAKIVPIDDFSCTVVAVGVGASQINASFEGDPTPGVDTITLSGAINVVPAEAATGELTFDTPVLQPAPAAPSA